MNQEIYDNHGNKIGELRDKKPSRGSMSPKEIAGCGIYLLIALICYSGIFVFIIYKLFGVKKKIQENARNGMLILISSIFIFTAFILIIFLISGNSLDDRVIGILAFGGGISYYTIYKDLCAIGKDPIKSIDYTVENISSVAINIAKLLFYMGIIFCILRGVIFWLLGIPL